MPFNKHFILNMSGAAINMAALLRIFRATNLRWEMHPAQLFSIEIVSTFIKETVSVVETEVKLEDVPKELLKPMNYTLLGIPIAVREDYPKGWIRLYAGDKLVGAIENLAIPSVYGSSQSWDELQKEEEEKARKLREADAI